MANLTNNALPRATGPGQIDDGSLTDDGAGNIGTINGVDITLTIAPVVNPGTTGYTYGKYLFLRGGNATGGYGAYAGSVYIYGGSASGATNYNTNGEVHLIGQNVVIDASDRVTLGGTDNGIFLNTSTINAVLLSGTPGASGTLYVDAGAGNVVKRVP